MTKQTELTIAIATMLVVNTCCQAAVGYVCPIILTLMAFAADTRMRKIMRSCYTAAKQRWDTPTERQQIAEIKGRLGRLSTLCATSFTVMETRVKNLGRKVEDAAPRHPETAGRQGQNEPSSDEEIRPPRYLRVPNTEGPARNTRSRRPQVTLKLKKNSDGNYQTVRAANTPVPEQSFYFSCKLCFVELWLASPSQADLCIACRPRLHKRDTSFTRLVNIEAEKLWFCCCSSCKENNTRHCLVNPCQACTQWRGFVDPQEADREL